MAIDKFNSWFTNLKSHIPNYLDNVHTDLGQIIQDISRKLYNNNALEGITTFNGTIYKIVNDPSQYVTNPLSDQNAQLKNGKTTQYYVYPEDGTGAIFPKPSSFDNTSESKILASCLPVCTLAPDNASNVEPQLGDPVKFKFYNNASFQGGEIYNVTPNNKGQASLSDDKVRKPSSASSDKSPPENS